MTSAQILIGVGVLVALCSLLADPLRLAISWPWVATGSWDYRRLLGDPGRLLSARPGVSVGTLHADAAGERIR